MTENDKAIQKQYEIDDKTMQTIIAETPDCFDELSQLVFKDLAASQIKGFEENMNEKMEKMKAKIKEEEMKEKEYVLRKLSLKLVKSSLEKALLEINKTTDQHSQIEHIYDGR